MATIEGLDLPTVEDLTERRQRVTAEVQRMRRLRHAITDGPDLDVDLPTPEALIAREDRLIAERKQIARLIRALRD